MRLLLDLIAILVMSRIAMMGLTNLYRLIKMFLYYLKQKVDVDWIAALMQTQGLHFLKMASEGGRILKARL